LKFRLYVQNPVLTHVQVKYDKFDAYDVEPLSVPDVFSERPVIIFGKYRGTPTGNITIKGMNGEGEYENSLFASTAKSSESNIALRYLWARERIRTLSDYASVGNGSDEYRPAIIELGLKYNLLTAYTSFLAIDNDIRNKEGSSTIINQPLPLPEGVSDCAVGGATVSAYRIPMEKKSMGYAVQEVQSIDGIKVKEESEMPFVVVETMPEFIGGKMGLEAFLAASINYPQRAQEKGIKGNVYVSFTVDKKGKVTDIKVLRGIGGGCDEEALRVIKLTSGKWKPGMQNGKPVKVTMSIPVKF